MDEYSARRLAERIALALQAALLLRSGSPAATAFVQSRLAGAHGLAFGTLEPGVPVEELLMRALP
ncbi:hypothetical protein NB689_003351 [Xanthomonas sacchari]|nr:hypothetical protein [Xanthomonas sacchari]